MLLLQKLLYGYLIFQNVIVLFEYNLFVCLKEEIIIGILNFKIYLNLIGVDFKIVLFCLKYYIKIRYYCFFVVFLLIFYVILIVVILVLDVQQYKN